MIFLSFSPLGNKLPFILQNGSQNYILNVRMNVFGKRKSLDWYQNFYHFRTSSENFSVFWQNFPTELSKQPSTCPERTSEKKTIWRMFQFCIICGHVAFFGFWPKVFSFCQKCGLGVQKNVSKNFCLQKFFSFITFGLCVGFFFDFWPSFFFGAITENAFEVHGGKILWIFQELFSSFLNFETLSGKLFVLAKAGSRVVKKTAFLRVKNSTVKAKFRKEFYFFIPLGEWSVFHYFWKKDFWNGFQRCSLPLQENVLGMCWFWKLFPSLWEFENFFIRLLSKIVWSSFWSCFLHFHKI